MAHYHMECMAIPAIILCQQYHGDEVGEDSMDISSVLDAALDAAEDGGKDYVNYENLIIKMYEK